MTPGWVVPSLDELEKSHACFGFGLELSPVEQFALECGEEAFTHCIVIAITNRPIDRRTPISLHRKPKTTHVYCDP